jgi:hemoglobin
VFESHVHDWPAHIKKISGFWRNAILHEQVYDGNPMHAHINAGNVELRAFETWLALFDQVLNSQLEPTPARQWSALAHRIGRSLSMGLNISQQKKRPDSAPVF